MASQSASTSIDELCKALYASCQAQERGKLFMQEDLLSLEVVPSNDLNLLLNCINTLMKDGLFKLMSKDNRSCYKVVSKEDAAKYRDLSTEEAIVFGYVESAGREGIWTKTIRNKSNLHQIVFTRCLKSLESRNLIRPTQNAKFPTRKLYILSHLQPFEEVSGGPFFTDGQVDEEYVHQMCRWLEMYVHRRSWYSNSKGSNKKKRDGGMADRDAGMGTTSTFSRRNTRDKQEKLLPMPPSYIGYPRLQEITKAINEQDLSSVVLKEEEVRHLLDLLCWDKRLVKVMNGKAYKSLSTSSEADFDRPNGLVESPCGRCPVFELCEENSPVNPRNCVYFQDWLAQI